MRLLRYILILPVLAYGLVWGYLWYDAYSSLNKLTQNAEPFAKIDYDSFFVSPLGNEFTVDGIVIVPQMAPDEFRIDQVRIASDQIGFFLLAGNSLQAGEPPENLTFNFKNIQFSLDNKLFSMLENMASRAAETSQQAAIPFENVDALGCGYVEKFQLANYRQMGINQINADLNLSMNYNKISEILNLQIDASTRGIYDMSISTDLHVPSGNMKAMAQSGESIPPVRVSINDAGFYKKRNAFCAGANESSVDEYVDKHMRLLNETLGITLPEQIASAYREYMLKGGRINISIKPKENVNGEELAYYKPMEALDLLGLKLTIGKTRIDIEQLLSGDTAMVANAAVEKDSPATEKKVEEKTAEQPMPESAKVAKSDMKEPAEQMAENTAAQKEVAPKADSKPAYHVEKVENAHQYIDQMVEVTLPGNKVREGTLEQIRNNRLYLVMKLRGGNLAYPVIISEVKKFRVMY